MSQEQPIPGNQFLRLSEIEEFNIGHSIISHAVFVGLERAVRAMREAIQAGEAN